MVTGKAVKTAIGAGVKAFLLVGIVGGAVAASGLPAKMLPAAPAPKHVAPVAAPKAAAVAKTQPQPVAAVKPPVEDAPYVIKSALQIDGPLKHGAYVWNDDGVPAGPILITVDLTAQTLSVFRDGYEIGVAVILYGATDKPSPLGTFPITQMKKHHVSNLYNAPMPYMLRLTNDGVAIHGSDVKWGSATHGCIGVPTEFAKLLFDQVKLGDRVIVTDGQMLQVGTKVPAA
jgi:lipoprotein-anchoring transpeptidase ErfK/SrfK